MQDCSALQLSRQLIQQPSITPNDCNCQEILIENLQPLGFTCETLFFGEGDETVKNLWATHGHGSPVLCFAGHTDVVPTGDTNSWTHPPFSANIADGYLYGRGAADMKTGVAAFTVAATNFTKKHPNHAGTIALLITADEEGSAINGTQKVVSELKKRQQPIDYCLVGEPSSSSVLGDVIKNGRRGSLSGVLTILGKQGHVAYPHLATNPIHVALPALTELSQTVWDEGNAHFPATSLQISNIHGGTGANNVIPATLKVLFNFRFSTQSSSQSLKMRTQEILNKHFTNSPASYTIDWSLSGEPFLTNEGALVHACQTAVQDIVGITPKLSTSGGTSDGRFIATIGAQVVELGVINAAIHQIDEHILASDVDKLCRIYERILEILLI